MKKILFLIAATFAIIGCNNKKKAEVFPVVVEKYTNEQASIQGFEMGNDR